MPAALSIMKAGVTRASDTPLGLATEVAGTTVANPYTPSVAPPLGSAHPPAQPMKLVTPPISNVIKAVPGAQTLPKGATTVVKAAVQTFTFHSTAEKARYERAARLFPSFCKEWQRLLHQREVNNLDHLTWQLRQGYETTTYTGYGHVESCQTKESVEGIPIGKITYDELSYYLAGKTVEEARRSSPKLVHQVHTLEIFSWDKNKWFY